MCCYHLVDDSGPMLQDTLKGHPLKVPQHSASKWEELLMEGMAQCLVQVVWIHREWSTRSRCRRWQWMDPTHPQARVLPFGDSS